MLDEVLGFFEITPDHDLDLMKPNQNLYSLWRKHQSVILKIIHKVIDMYFIPDGLRDRIKKVY